MKLNLGCGTKRREGFLGVDRFPCPGADVLCDITRSLPFREGTIDEVLLDNVIEHVLDVPALMAEIARVGRPGARVTVITPHFTAQASWRDPTHLHHFSYFSMDHFEKPSVAHYTGGGFRVERRKLSFAGGPLGFIGRLFFALSPTTWEKQLCFLFRGRTLKFELRVVK